MEAMLKSFTKTALLALGVILSLSTEASAQKIQPFGDVSIQHYHDFQLFSPYDLGDFGEYPEPAYGFYIAYDRMMLNVNRPNDATASQQGDWAWGNRYDAGYMTDSNHGWNISYFNLGSPNAREIVEYPSDSGDGRLDANTINLDGQSTENSNTTYSVELNKVWRHIHKPWGLVIEPYCGARYMQFNENVQLDTFDFVSIDTFDYTIVDENGDLVTFAVDSPFGDDETIDVGIVGRDTTRVTDLTSIRSFTENNLIGGQFGSRFVWERGRWTLSADTKGFVMHNFVHRRARVNLTRITDTRSTVIATIPPVGAAGSFGSDQFVNTEQLANNEIQNTVRNVTSFGAELRLEAAYNFSKAFALRGGFEGLVVGKGMDRGGLGVNEELMLFGVTMGLEFNR